MSYTARTHRSATGDYRVRALLRDTANFAKGVLIGGVVVVSLWLLLG